MRASHLIGPRPQMHSWKCWLMMHYHRLTDTLQDLTTQIWHLAKSIPKKPISVFVKECLNLKSKRMSNRRHCLLSKKWETGKRCNLNINWIKLGKMVVNMPNRSKMKWLFEWKSKFKWSSSFYRTNVSYKSPWKSYTIKCAKIRKHKINSIRYSRIDFKLNSKRIGMLGWPLKKSEKKNGRRKRSKRFDHKQ